MLTSHPPVSLSAHTEIATSPVTDDTPEPKSYVGGMSRRSRRMRGLVSAGAFLLSGVLASGCAVDESTVPFTGYDVAMSHCSQCLDPSADGEQWAATMGADRSVLECVRARLIRLLTINSLLTTHAPFIPG